QAGAKQPVVGNEILGFRLCRELGRGRFATVFLAESRRAGTSLVVIRISALGAATPAGPQLEHPAIVPILACRNDVAAGLRLVAMPFLGGATLSAVLAALWRETSQPTRAAQL